ncbi:MAG: HAD family hydrolase [Planctomycetota bacterium]
MEFQAILFDLDGTLLDTLADIANAANRALRRLGFPTHPIDTYRHFVGDGAGCLAARVLGDNNDDGEMLDLARKTIAAEYRKCWAETTRPYPGIPELLAELQTRGVPKVVLSNKPHDSTTAVVEHFFPDYNFQIVRGALPDVPVKPDPAGAFQIAGELGIEPQRFIYLGDTNTDMQTAVAAGMFGAGVLWGFRTAEELTASGAKALLKEPHDLLTFLDGR